MAWKDNVHSPVTFVCLDVSLKPPTVDSLFLRSHLPYIVSVTPDCRTLKESFRLHSLLGTDCWQNWRFDLMHCYSLFLKAICDCFRLVPQTNRLPFGVLFLELLVFQKSVLFHLHFYLSFHQLPSQHGYAPATGTTFGACTMLNDMIQTTGECYLLYTLLHLLGEALCLSIASHNCAQVRLATPKHVASSCGGRSVNRRPCNLFRVIECCALDWAIQKCIGIQIQLNEGFFLLQATCIGCEVDAFVTCTHAAVCAGFVIEQSQASCSRKPWG